MPLVGLHLQFLDLNVAVGGLRVLLECFVLEFLRIVEGVGLARDQVVMLFYRNHAWLAVELKFLVV